MLLMMRPFIVTLIFAIACAPAEADSIGRSNELDASSDPSSLESEVSLETAPFTPSEPAAFTGSWEVVSDDGTNTETAELELSNGIVVGVLRSLERGYYSGRVTVTAEVAVRGTPRAG